MEDYVVAQFKQVEDNELGLFAIFDGHLSHEIPDYLRTHLFENILKEVTNAAQTGDETSYSRFGRIDLISYHFNFRF